MQTDLISQMRILVRDGQLQRDEAQLQAAAVLEEIRAYLEATSRARKSLLGSLRERWKPVQPPGLYLWGGVGSGKSMLMDLFFAATDIERKRRVHFHAFMQEIHNSLHGSRKDGQADPLAHIAAKVAKEARLLCFDELEIVDITDAMIVGRLFENLLGLGVTIVSTSNRAPGELYQDGLNRQLFLPFIDLLASRMVVHHVLTELDYRQETLRGTQTWFCPIGAKSTGALDKIWFALTGGEDAPLKLRVKGRDVTLAAFHNGVARATFTELCENPLGTTDYLAIAAAIRVLVVDDIPTLSRARNNEARRFILLIDTLYEAGICLIASAASEPEALYRKGPGAFEFRRTASRLREMQSADWAGGGHA